MNSALMLSALFCIYATVSSYAADCAGGMSGTGLAPHNTVLFVWAKTVDDNSAFPSWTNVTPAVFADFYAVMSYNQHTITTRVATQNDGFFVSDFGHTVQYYKDQFQSGQGYLGPYGIFVEEILQKVEIEYGAAYFDDVDVIMMMITDGGFGWYSDDPNLNATGVGYLGVQYTTGNGKTFGYFDGVNNEFSQGEKVTEFIVCHEYGHFLGLPDYGPNYGTYSLMQNNKVNEANEGVTPLSVKDVMDLGWLDVNDGTRVQTVTANASVTLQPLRSSSGIVAAKLLPDANDPYSYFLVANHQRSTNPYDGTYPDDGLLVWQISGISYTDIECGVGLDPITYGFNKDHLDLYDSDPANYHGEGLASDFFKPSSPNQFTQWSNPNTDLPGSSAFPTNLAVTNITSNGTIMTFDVVYNFASGAITVDSWWRNTNDNILNGLVTVNEGVTVTALPNAKVWFDPGSRLEVYGTLTMHEGVWNRIWPNDGIVLKVFGSLNVLGTSTVPVIFETRASGNWTGIRFKNNSVGNINWATIRDANRGVWVDLSDNITVDNCTIKNFTEYGVYLNASSATIQNCEINNGVGAASGIRASGNVANPTIANNTISNVPVGIVRVGNPGLATISGNDIFSCDDGIYMNYAGPDIYNNYIHDCDVAIRLGPACVPDIHDNDFFANNTGVYIEQSQPSRLRYNNFGWTGGSVTQGHADPNLQEGVLVNYLTSDNVFLNNNRNNFYDGIVFDSQLNADIRNLTSVTLMAKRNFWVQQTVTGPINVNFPEANHNNNAGPTGGMGKTSAEQETIVTGQPTDFLLKQNYPNPFNPSTIIPFSLPKKAIVSIGIYDVTGALVSELVRRQTYESGQFELVWNGADHTGRPVSSGIYVYRLHAQDLEGDDSFVQACKLLVVR